jgi:hypothetical protein
MQFSIYIYAIIIINSAYSLSFPPTIDNNNLFGQYIYSAEKLLKAVNSYHAYSYDNFTSVVFDGLIDFHRFILNTGYPDKNFDTQNKSKINYFGHDDLNLVTHYLEEIDQQITECLVKTEPKSTAIHELLHEAKNRLNYLKKRYF